MSNPAPGFSQRPDHTLRFETCQAQATHGTTVVARSDEAVKLFEASYPPVIYFPAADRVETHFASEADHSTYCPFKGHASYWNLIGTDGTDGKRSVWSYEEPYDECEGIRGYVAFYGDRVTVEEL
ncbi:MAG: DUF427 domain-containing protein [Acidobacteriota bacterium]